MKLKLFVFQRQRLDLVLEHSIIFLKRIQLSLHAQRVVLQLLVQVLQLSVVVLELRVRCLNVEQSFVHCLKLGL